jgi:hypothetical protein
MGEQSLTHTGKNSQSVTALAKQINALNSISLADQRSQTVSLEQVTTPENRSLRRLVEEHGYDSMLRVVTNIVQQADIMLGGDGDPSRCVPTAANALTSNMHRGVGFLVVAIREGMRGKVYGNKITVQLMNEWTSAQEGIIIGMAESAHARVVAKNDNVGRDWMDRQQHNSEADKRKMARMSEHIEDLKAKLSNHESGQG